MTSVILPIRLSISAGRIHLNNECASFIYVPLGKWFYQLDTKGDTERLHACMGSPVCDEEAEVDHRCLITLNVMCLAIRQQN